MGRAGIHLEDGDAERARFVGRGVPGEPVGETDSPGTTPSSGQGFEILRIEPPEGLTR